MREPSCLRRAVLACLLACLPPALIGLPACSEVCVQLNHSNVEPRYAFDVVSIRPSAKEGFSRWRAQRDGYFATNVTAQQLIFDAYQTADPDGFVHIISLEQIRGLPKWGDTQQFDVSARVDEQTMSQLSGTSDPERKRLYQAMLQPVLQERFHMAAHHERREQPVYLLKVAPEGNRMVLSSAPFEKSSLRVGRSQLHAKGSNLDPLVETLTQSLGRIVVDQTRLRGFYDFDLKWAPETQADVSSDSPSIYQAIREQLGLELVPSKGPVDSIVVTRLDEPTPN